MRWMVVVSTILGQFGKEKITRIKGKIKTDTDQTKDIKIYIYINVSMKC